MPLAPAVRALTLVLLSIFVAQVSLSSGSLALMFGGLNSVSEVTSRSFDMSFESDNLNPALAKVNIDLTRFWSGLSGLWKNFITNTKYFLGKIAKSWKGLLGGRSVDDQSPQARLLIDPQTIESLKREIMAELLLEIGGGGIKKPDLGVVVLPSSGNPSQDLLLTEDLKQAFSDQVDIQFSAGGQSGIITPIGVSAVSGQDYLFIITPIKPVRQNSN